MPMPEMWYKDSTEADIHRRETSKYPNKQALVEQSEKEARIRRWRADIEYHQYRIQALEELIRREREGG